MITLVCDIDGTLTGSSFGVKKFNDYVKNIREYIFLIYATGRNLNDYNKVINQEGLLLPDAFIINVGTDIYIKNKGQYIINNDWHVEIEEKNWDVNKIKEALSQLRGIKLQDFIYKYKISYFVNELEIDDIKNEILKIFNDKNINANLIFSHGIYLDILPEKCNKANAVKFILKKMKLCEENVIVAGDSENDLDLFLNFKYGIVVNNANENLKNILKNKGFYISNFDAAEGVVDGLKYYLSIMEI